MGKLIFIANISLDGFTTDKDGDFNWTEPNDEVFMFITDLIRPMHTHIYGRRMYETMMVWETDPRFAEESALMRDFAEVWQAADKIVFSRTLEKVSTLKTRIEHDFHPKEVRQLKAASDHDIHIAGLDEFLAYLGFVASGTGGLGRHNESRPTLLVEVTVEVADPNIVAV